MKEKARLVLFVFLCLFAVWVFISAKQYREEFKALTRQTLPKDDIGLGYTAPPKQ